MQGQGESDRGHVGAEQVARAVELLDAIDDVLRRVRRREPRESGPGEAN